MSRTIKELPLGATKICKLSSVDVALFYFDVLRTAKVNFITGHSDYDMRIDLYVMEDTIKRAKRVMEIASKYIDYLEASSAHTFLYSDN